VLAKSINTGKHIIQVYAKDKKHEEGRDHHYQTTLERKETKWSINIPEVQPLIFDLEVGEGLRATDHCHSANQGSRILETFWYLFVPNYDVEKGRAEINKCTAKCRYSLSAEETLNEQTEGEE
jgi:hypothetical protein